MYFLVQTNQTEQGNPETGQGEGVQVGRHLVERTQGAVRLRGQQLPLVGKRIRQLRKDRDLTQAELASKVGVQQSDLCRMETGEYKVSLETLFKILKIFEMNFSEFFHEAPGEQADIQEAELLQAYRSLPPSGQGEVRHYARFLLQQSRKNRRKR